MTPVCRIFLSSPSDVADERTCVSDVFQSVRHDWSGRLTLELFDWREEYYTAHATFQDQIPQPSECELVVCLFWKRLGSDLPEQFRRGDGSLPTGSEFEFENAISGASKREDKLPDVLVYRKMADVTFSVDHFEQEKQEYERFLLFWRRWFRNEQGHFIAGFQTFKTIEDLRAQFDSNLRKWLQDRYGRAAWAQGSPFRGLSPFLEEHSSIFFGRRREVDRARARLVASALAGFPFLLVIGASGSGKSSLVRAGLVPRLKVPGGLPGYRIMASVTLAPGEIANNWSLGMARAIFDSDLAQFLRKGDSPTPETLGSLLTAKAGLAPVVGALARASEAVALSGETAVLLLVIDQLEEVFSWPAPAAEAFLGQLEAMVASGRVVLVATMRSDFQHRMAEIAPLERLAGRAEVHTPDTGGRTIEISLPTSADLHEMIEKPAEAAGLEFEITDGVDLAARIKAEASPENMPAISLLLQQLYEMREGSRLTLDAYNRLGGVAGVLATHGETTLAALPPATVAAFPTVVRALVTRVGPGAPVTARRVSVDSFADQPAVIDLLRAFTTASLVVSDKGVVRFAHDTLIEHWKRVRDIVEMDRRLFDIRERLERDCERWKNNLGLRRRRLTSLLRDLSLEEGKELLSAWGPKSLQDKDPLLPQFIRESIYWGRLRRWGAISAIAVAAAVVSGLIVIAQSEKREAQISRLLARTELMLRAGNAMDALAPAREAFERQPSDATRSMLLGATMQISPYLVRRLRRDANAPWPIVWLDSAHLAYADSGNVVRTISLESPGIESTARVPIRRDDNGNVFELVHLRRIGQALIGVEGDGALVRIGNRSGTLRPGETQLSIPTNKSSAVVTNADGRLTLVASTTDPPYVLTCDRSFRCDRRVIGSSFADGGALDESGGRLATVDGMGNLSIYSRDGTSQPTVIQVGNGSHVLALSWNPRHAWIAIARENATVSVLDLDHNTRIELGAGRGAVSAITWSPDGNWLAFTCDETTVCVSDAHGDGNGAPSDTTTLRLSAEQGHLLRLAWSADSKHLASAGDRGDIVIWSLQPDRHVFFDLPQREAGTSIATSPNGANLAVAHASGAIDVWDAALNLPQRLAAMAPGSPHMVWTPEGQLASLYSDGTLVLWPGGRPTARSWNTGFLPRDTDNAGQVAWTASGLNFVTSDFRVAHVDPARQTRRLEPARSRVVALASDVDGKVMVESRDGGQIIWDAGGPGEKEISFGDTVSPYGLAIASDRALLATTGGTASIHLFNVSRGAWSALDMESDEPSGAIGFNADASLLAAIDASDILYVWRVSGGQGSLFLKVNVQPYLGVRDVSGLHYATGLAWLANNHLAIVLANGQVRILNLQENDWLDRLTALH